jgi:two-component system, chemotaxis family, response regulator WspF
MNNFRQTNGSTASRKQLLIAIGSSAGGPAAVAKILSAIPSSIPASFIVVQHVDAQFASGLATWLDSQTKLSVRLAEAGDRPAAGSVLVSGRNDHLIFRDSSALGYTSDPKDCAYRPSVDVFFQSIVRHWKSDVIGILLTGMGRDGANGLKLLREAGHHTITQDRATSAVYGMPKAAAELNAAVEILALDRIVPTLLKRILGTNCFLAA